MQSVKQQGWGLCPLPRKKNNKAEAENNLTGDQKLFTKQEAFEKCWAHSLSASRGYTVSHQVSLVARQL